MSGLVAKVAKKAAEKEMKSQMKGMNTEMENLAKSRSGPRRRSKKDCLYAIVVLNIALK